MFNKRRGELTRARRRVDAARAALGQPSLAVAEEHACTVKIVRASKQRPVHHHASVAAPAGVRPMNAKASATYTIIARHVVTKQKIARLVSATSPEAALWHAQRTLDGREWQVADAKVAK
jgi:hypothetical protein